MKSSLTEKICKILLEHKLNEQSTKLESDVQLHLMVLKNRERGCTNLKTNQVNVKVTLKNLITISYVVICLESSFPGI